MPDSVDYSYARPPVAALRKAGVKLVARYLSFTPAKNLSDAERKELHAAGIGILLNWESVSARPLGGATTGREDGAEAAKQAEALGAPHGLAIFYSCDTDTQQSQWPLIADYYAAAGKASAGRYKVGVYGEADLIDYLHKRGVVTSEWQTYAWSNGRLSANADLFQYLNSQTIGGGAVDFDRIIHPDQLGAWWPTGSEYDVPSADEIAKAVWAYALADGDGTKEPAGAWLKQARNLSDPTKLADALVKRLPQGGVSQTEIEQALRAVFADLGSAQ